MNQNKLTEQIGGAFQVYERSLECDCFLPIITIPPKRGLWHHCVGSVARPTEALSRMPSMTWLLAVPQDLLYRNPLFKFLLLSRHFQ